MVGSWGTPVTVPLMLSVLPPVTDEERSVAPARLFNVITPPPIWAPELPRIEVPVTDTVPLRPGAPDMIRQLTCADILTDTVRRIFTDDSVSEIFAGENQLF